MGRQEASALMDIVNRRGFDDLKIDDWPPQPAARSDRHGKTSGRAVQDHDVLLMHPYEDFDTVVKFAEQAAEESAGVGDQADSSTAPAATRRSCVRWPGPRRTGKGSDRPWSS